MIRKKQRQVVIIGDIKSDLIEQAIFILRNDDALDGDIVSEATDIIRAYNHGTTALTPQTKASAHNRGVFLRTVYVAIAVLSVIMASVLVLQLCK